MKIGCTSYIYPADIVSNVEKLGELVDDIELLIFEGAEKKSLPAPAEVRRLAGIASQSGVSYTVHLPLDLDVCSSDTDFRMFSNDRMEEIVDLFSPLNPYGFVLHLPGGETGNGEWTENAVGAARLLGGKCRGKLFVENLTYPFRRLEPVFEQSDALVCLDIGHAQAAGDDWREIYGRFGEKVGVIHFYLRDRDSGRHLGIENSPRGFASGVVSALLSSRYEGILTIEMFCEKDFFSSKKIVEREIENWAER